MPVFFTRLCAIIPEILAELGEFLDEADRHLEGRAVDPGDERDILATREVGIM